MPSSPKFPKNFNGKAYSNVLEVCNICLELPSDSGKYFGFVVEEFSKLSCAYYKIMLCLLAGQSFHATIVTCHGCCVAGL